MALLALDPANDAGAVAVFARYWNFLVHLFCCRRSYALTTPPTEAAYSNAIAMIAITIAGTTTPRVNAIQTVRASKSRMSQFLHAPTFSKLSFGGGLHERWQRSNPRLSVPWRYPQPFLAKWLS
jgi:hypothetical protein